PPARPNPNLICPPGTTFAPRTAASTCSPTTLKRFSCVYPTTTPEHPSASSCRSTPATSSSAGYGCCGTDSTGANRLANTSADSSPESRRGAGWYDDDRGHLHGRRRGTAALRGDTGPHG